MGLALQTKLQATQIETWNTIKSVEFLSIFSVSMPLKNAKPPYWKLSSDGSESAVYSQEDLTQMKQEVKYLRAQWHE